VQSGASVVKIFQVPFCFQPDRVGGTETYVATLAADLIQLGVDVVIAAPGRENQSYEIDGLCVRRFATSDTVSDLAELYGGGDEYAARNFASLLDEEKPDIVHLHAFTHAVSVRLIDACHARKIPVIFTYHTPTVSCQRGTMMLWGETPCDGELDATRCASCTLQGLGLDRSLSRLVSRLPPALQGWMAEKKLQGGLWTAARMGELVQRRHEAVRQLLSRADHIVAVCQWAREVLLTNGTPAAKVSLCTHGINWPEDISPVVWPAESRASDTVKIAFVGRIDINKGIHVLIDALRLLPEQRVTLDIFGSPQSDANLAYRDDLVRRATGDSRISFKGSLPSHEVMHRLKGYDFLAVPSQWMETGPLVILEAFAAGIPIIGSRLGGVANLVQDEVNGLLVEPWEAMRWRDAFLRIATDPAIRKKLRTGVSPPRRSLDVAYDMLALYSRHIGTPKTRVAALNA
jgi:glycosyltransferase involved in cell wall biosynthesis